MSIVLTQLAEDNFATDPDSSPLPSPPWQATSGFTMEVESGLATGTISGTGCENYAATTPNDDQYASATIEEIDSWNGAAIVLGARASGGTPSGFLSFSDGYVLYVYAPNGSGTEAFLQLYSITNGVGTLIFQGYLAGTVINDGDVWSLALIGTTLYVLQNGSVVYSTTDATYASGFTALGAYAFEGTPYTSLFAMGDATFGVVATSTFNPAAGAVPAGTSVTLNNVDSALPGFAMYYTTDGSTPTTGSTPYTGPITLSLPETIKVLAVATGLTDSAIASASYTLRASTPPRSSNIFGSGATRITDGRVFGTGRTRITWG